MVKSKLPKCSFVAVIDTLVKTALWIGGGQWRLVGWCNGATRFFNFFAPSYLNIELFIV